MMINDLPLHQDLAHDELACVRGGSNSIVQGGQYAPALGQSGPSFFSSQTVTNAAVNNPVAQLSDNDLSLRLTNETTNVAQSFATFVRQ